MRFWVVQGLGEGKGPALAALVGSIKTLLLSTFFYLASRLSFFFGKVHARLAA
jgi:hypothetical protein